MQRWLSWSKAHDWKSCVRLITDREFESLPLREIRKRIFIGSLSFCAQREKKGARKSAANFFTLDYERILRDSTEMKIHFILSEKDRRKDWRLFDFISPLRVGRPFQGEHRDAQTPHLCEFRLAVAVALHHILLVSPT